MKLGLIESAWFGSHIDPITGLKKAKEIGFDTYDILHDPHDMNAIEKKQFRNAIRETGLPIVSICVVYPGVIDLNRNVREFNIQNIRDQLDWGYSLGCSNMLFVLGEYIWEELVIKPEIQWSWAIDALREIGDHAESLDMQIAVELEPFKNSLINTVDKMVRFLKDVNHPAVKANADVSHLHLTSPRTPPTDMKKLEGRIIHVHFSDNNGEGHGDMPPGRGNAPLRQYLEQLKVVGFKGSITIELEFYPETDQIVEWVIEAYTATAQMMDDLKVRDK
jgi:sugar phosphate isomerase/epimerase